MTTEARPTPTPTPERLMQFAFGYAPPLIIQAAIQHKIFDHLAGGPKNVEELTKLAGVSSRGLRAVCNALTSLEFLTKDSEGRYQLTPESRTFLVSTSPAYHGGFFSHVVPLTLPHWLKLSEAVRDGRPKTGFNEEDQGTSFFIELVENIFPMSYQAAQKLGEALKLKSIEKPFSVLDLAAGSGVWGIALAQLSPHVAVTAVDWPGVLPVTRRMAERFRVAERFRLVPGDIQTADFGSGHAAATLGHILHSEGEERSRSLLKRVFNALAPGGTIVIAEFVMNDDYAGPPHAAIFAVNMLVHTEAGDTFSFAHMALWLKEAGFTDVRRLEAPGPSPLILATRPA